MLQLGVFALEVAVCLGLWAGVVIEMAVVEYVGDYREKHNSAPSSLRVGVEVATVILVLLVPLALMMNGTF